MTDTLERLAELEAKATAGPWSNEVNFYKTGATVIFGPKPEQVLVSEDTQFSTDAAFITELRNAFPEIYAKAKAQEEEIERLKEALEWALDQAGADHPHYPYRDGSKWGFPYLIIGDGAGVGSAVFDTAFEAVDAAKALERP